MWDHFFNLQALVVAMNTSHHSPNHAGFSPKEGVALPLAARCSFFTRTVDVLSSVDYTYFTSDQYHATVHLRNETTVLASFSLYWYKISLILKVDPPLSNSWRKRCACAVAFAHCNISVVSLQLVILGARWRLCMLIDQRGMVFAGENPQDFQETSDWEFIEIPL